MEDKLAVDERDIATLDALVQAEVHTHYAKTDQVHNLRVRLIIIRQILGDVIDWYAPDDAGGDTPADSAALE